MSAAAAASSSEPVAVARDMQNEEKRWADYQHMMRCVEADQADLEARSQLTTEEWHMLHDKIDNKMIRRAGYEQNTRLGFVTIAYSEQRSEESKQRENITRREKRKAQSNEERRAASAARKDRRVRQKLRIAADRTVIPECIGPDDYKYKRGAGKILGFGPQTEEQHNRERMWRRSGIEWADHIFTYRGNKIIGRHSRQADG